MCDFVSWIEKDDQILFLTDDDLDTKKGKELIKYCMCLEDTRGHGAIRHYYNFEGGIDKECTDLSNPDNFPKQIQEALKQGKMCSFDPGSLATILTPKARKEYDIIKQSAWNKYLKIQQSAWKEYDIIQQSARKEYRKIRQSAWNKYLKIQQSARKEYDIIQQSAWNKYLKIQQSAWKEYDIIQQSAWKEYDIIQQSARKEYRKIQQSARKEYDIIQQSAWNKYLKIQQSARKEYDIIQQSAWNKYLKIQQSARKECSRKLSTTLKNLIKNPDNKIEKWRCK